MTDVSARNASTYDDTITVSLIGNDPGYGFAAETTITIFRASEQFKEGFRLLPSGELSLSFKG
jgi:hypothetical protein